jgi:TP901 family phage tail tape measure protein
MSNKKYSATITIGGALHGSLGAAFSSAASKVGKLGDALKKVKQDYVELTREQLKQKRIGEAMAGMKRGKEQMGGAIGGLGIVGAVAGAAAFPVVQAARFETAMLGVAKQVDGARDSSGKLTSVYFDMKKQIQELGRTMPMATSEIAEMAAAGARMGIAREELIEFTRTAGMMAEAFELPAGELADQMGKIRTLFGLKTQKEVRALADSVNYLDDNAISKGGDIIEFLQRTGGVAGAVKITAQQMAALGSTMLTLGTPTNVAGTAVNAIFQKLAAAEKGTKKFKRAMGELGLGLKDVQSGMQLDAQGTLLKVLDRIQAMPQAKRLGAMVELVGLEHSDELAKLAAGVGEYRKQIELAGSQKAEGSMSREFAARLGTTAAQFELAKNRASELGETIGSMLLPAVNEALPRIGDLVTKSAEWSGENNTLLGNVGTLGGALMGGLAAFKLYKLGLGGVTFAFNALKLAMASHPLWVAATVAGAAALLIYKNWEPIKAFFGDLWDGITAGATKAFEWVIGKLEWVKGKLGLGGPSLPEVPAVAGLRGANSSVMTQQNNFTLNQQPGQDGQDMARMIAQELARQQSVARRSSMLDPVGAF